MTFDKTRARQLLKNGDLRTLFIEALGWDGYSASLNISVSNSVYRLQALAHKRGMIAWFCPSLAGQEVPDYAERRKIERLVAKSSYEHFIVFSDATNKVQIWQWVKRELGKPAACREHTFHRDQSGEALITKLQALAFCLDEEADITIVDVTSRVRVGFDIEKVTKQFYESFKDEHDTFLRFLKGIPDKEMQRWYVSVMLNRLMFIYFIQWKGFINADQNYLRNNLVTSKFRGKDRFYKEFLCTLFFEGFARRESDRSAAANTLLGNVPYLNGGLFLKHKIEELHGRTIEISDTAFERLFEFFDRWNWRLDERPLKKDYEINPDVLGYIFEKYINQKQMGAYYTKEDITGYISRNTVIPFLFNAANIKYAFAFKGKQSIWRLLADDPYRYILKAIRRGVVDDAGLTIPETLLPDFVRKGINDPKARISNRDYNFGLAIIPDINGSNLALPNETWSEYIERRKRCFEIHAKISRGEVCNINDLITLNLDIEQFALDVIENSDEPELVSAFWCAIERVSILDPTCGSGAFLFAALNILESLYEACLDRMEAFLEERDQSNAKPRSEKFVDFRKVLDRVSKHPNRKYFVYKSIVINNLFGVDIMEEAVEICKLRLFLKLVAQIERPDQIEPLPDIDFNICAGNTLVGYVTYEQVAAGQGKIAFEDTMKRIEQAAIAVEKLFSLFRLQQIDLGGTVSSADKQKLRAQLDSLESELNQFLAIEYAVDLTNKKAFANWVNTHKPFHWFVEFYGIMKNGGFDVVIGNPPYVSAIKVRQEYDVRGYHTEGCSDIYAWVLERSASLLRSSGRSGMIVPLSLTFSGSFSSCRDLLSKTYSAIWYSSFGRIPAALFNFDVRVRNTIYLGLKSGDHFGCFTTRLHRWFESERCVLFQKLEYTPFQPKLWKDRIPKLDTTRIAMMYEQLLESNKSRVAFSMSGPATDHILYFKKTAYNWLCFALELPPCYDERGRSIKQTKFGTVYFQNKNIRDASLLLLNGKLMFIFWCIVGDDFDVTQWMFEEFPADIKEIVKNYPRDLGLDATRLRKAMVENVSFKLNAGKRVGNFNLAKCRDITDSIDLKIMDILGISEHWQDIEFAYARMVKTSFYEEEEEKV